MNVNPWVQIAKYVLVALIWTGVILFGIALSGNIAVAGGEGAPMVGMGIAAFIAAAIATAATLAGGSKETEKETFVETSRKRKNSAALGADPMSLLTEDDIEELRAEFKDGLRRRYLQDLNEYSASEPASFEALLEDRQRKRR